MSAQQRAGLPALPGPVLPAPPSAGGGPTQDGGGGARTKMAATSGLCSWTPSVQSHAGAWRGLAASAGPEPRDCGGTPSSHNLRRSRAGAAALLRGVGSRKGRREAGPPLRDVNAVAPPAAAAVTAPPGPSRTERAGHGRRLRLLLLVRGRRRRGGSGCRLPGPAGKRDRGHRERRRLRAHRRRLGLRPRRAGGPAGDG